MKKTKLIVLLLLISFMGFSQKLKIYSGEYPNEFGTNGIANYTYYEDTATGDYIKHGQFKYNMKKGINYNAVFTGSFKNGRREGLWTYSITLLDDAADNVFYTGIIKLTANYLDGLPNGAWSYSNTMKYRGKVRIIGGYQWTNYEEQPNVSVLANFKNGITVGTIKIINDIGKYKIITGTFNADGFLDKTWSLKSISDEIKMTFNNGIQTSYVNRDFPIGKVYENIIDDDEMIKLKNDFLSNRITTDDLLKKRITIDTISAINNDLYTFANTLYSNFFNYKNIEGDDTYDTEGNNIRDDGYYFIFKKAELIKLSEIEYYNEIQSTFKSGSEAIFKYENFLSGYKLNLSTDDISIVENKIEQLKKNVIINGKRNDLTSAAHWLSESYFDKAQEEYEAYLENWKDNLTQDEVTEINKKIEESKEGTKQQQIKAENLEILKKKNELERNKQQIENDERTKISNLKSIISGKWYTIDNLYGENTSNSRRYMKYSIFDVFKTTYDEYLKSIQLSSSYENLKQTIADYNRVVKVADKVIELGRISDTKEIEREIKKAKTIKDKQDILLNYLLTN